MDTEFGNEHEQRMVIVELGRRLYQRAFVAANDGNISVRLSPDWLLATPTGVSKGFMKAEDLVLVRLHGDEWRGPIKPSTEIAMHRSIYKVRPDVNAVVHAHPPYATAFSVAGLPLDRSILAEVIVSLGTIPVADYKTPSTLEFAEQVAHYAREHDAILLANHGAVTMGNDPMQAHFRMETLEHYARISFLVRHLGQENSLSFDQVRELMELRSFYGFAQRSPGGDSAPETVKSLTVQQESSYCGPAKTRREQDGPSPSPHKDTTVDQVSEIVIEVLRRLGCGIP